MSNELASLVARASGNSTNENPGATAIATGVKDVVEDVCSTSKLGSEWAGAQASIRRLLRRGGDDPWPYLGSPEGRAALFRTELVSAALGYAAKGYPVFPALMIDGQKKPLTRWGKGEDGHPDLTQRRATTDPATVKAWWARWPLAMIGMPTGKPSGVVVLDIDRKNGVDGLANLQAIGIDAHSLSPVISITPSGGLHVFMRYNGPLKNSAGLLAAGVDVRGDGGYIVLPPSLPDINRDEYQWEGGMYGCL